MQAQITAARQRVEAARARVDISRAHYNEVERRGLYHLAESAHTMLENAESGLRLEMEVLAILILD